MGKASKKRLKQKSGKRNVFGGYEKKNHGNGTFLMKKSK